MRVLGISAIALLICTSTSFARLGETETQLIARYGSPTKEILKTGVKDLWFEKDGIRIEVEIGSGKAIRLCYTKGGNMFTEIELTGLLSVNGTKWVAKKHDERNKKTIQWNSAEGKEA